MEDYYKSNFGWRFIGNLIGKSKCQLFQTKLVVGVSKKKMSDSVYKVVELVGTSPDSWEDAIKIIVAKASKTLRDLRIAEVILLDVKIEDQKVALFRAKVKLSFKFEA